MAKEAFDAIYLAEKEAAELLKEARMEAQDRLDRADEEALRRVNEVFDDADADAERIRKEAREAGEKRACPILEVAKKEAARYDACSGARLEAAVEDVLEAVISYGHR